MAAVSLPRGGSLSTALLRRNLSLVLRGAPAIRADKCGGRAEGRHPPNGLWLRFSQLVRVISRLLIACMCGVLQAVKHEAPITSPTPTDGLLDAETCRRVIKMSVGPLVWRLVSR